MAPPLETLVREYLEPGEKPYVSPAPGVEPPEQKEQYKERMEQDNLAKLEALVVKHKDDLWWYWTHVDSENSGKVSSALWRQGMSSCLQLDLPWYNLQRLLVDVDADLNVNYKDFLERCRPHVDGEKAFESGWEYKVVHKAYEAMLNTDMALQKIIQLFDSDGDGLVSPQEFKQALQAANIGLPETQAQIPIFYCYYYYWRCRQPHGAIRDPGKRPSFESGHT
jgi:Ca2+-binding EF-hand superfamily protein